MTDWGAVYATSVDGIAAVAAELREEDLGRVVPATPEWTVHEVMAHLAGGSGDATAGRMDGAPGPEWTARHVAERADRSVAELVAELRATQSAVESIAGDSERPAVVWDKVVHLADLHEALGLDRPDPATWQPVAAAMRPRLAHLLDLEDLADDVVDDYAVVRVSFSRRSRRQLAELFPAASAEVIERLGVFGARDDDQPVI